MDVSTPEQILRQASEAASAIIPQLESDRASLLAKLQEIDTKISQLRNLIIAYPVEQMPDVVRALPEPAVPLQESIFNESQSHPANKAPRGQLFEHIRSVLSPVVPMTAKQIKDALEAKFSIDYNRSSIHQTLQRGLKSGAFSCTNNLWMLSL